MSLRLNIRDQNKKHKHIWCKSFIFLLSSKHILHNHNIYNECYHSRCRSHYHYFLIKKERKYEFMVSLKETCWFIGRYINIIINKKKKIFNFENPERIKEAEGSYLVNFLPTRGGCFLPSLIPPNAGYYRVQ